MTQQQLDELVDLVGKQPTVRCPVRQDQWADEPDGSHPPGCHGGCEGTGKVTDPQAQAAWEVFHWQCDWPKHTHTHYVHYEYDEDRDSDTYQCGDWIPHNIKYWPDGAVEGMLLQAWNKYEGGDTHIGDSVDKAATAFKEALEQGG